MDSVLCLSVSRDRGEKARQLLKILELFSENWTIESDDVRLYIPLLRRPSSEEIEKISEDIGQYELVYRKLKAGKKKEPRNLREFLVNKLTSSQLDFDCRFHV